MNLSGLTMPQIMRLYGRNDRDFFLSCSEMADERPTTLFFADFKVAEFYGINAVKDTYKGCGDLTKRDYKEVTELSMVLNHLLWAVHGGLERERAKLPEAMVKALESLYKLYETWYYYIDEEVVPTWDKEKRKYYYSITD